MARYLIFAWFVVRVLITATAWFTPLVISLILFLLGNERGIKTLVICDEGVACWIYSTTDRTISGICGEKKLNNEIGYTLIANFINYLAEKCGDEPLHCERIYKDEV